MKQTQKNNIDISAILSQSPLFCHCGLDVHSFSLHQYHKGDTISDHPGGVASVGLIASGAVDVYSLSTDGNEIKLSGLSQGNAFGICNLFAASDMETVLKCRKSTTVLFVAKETLLQALSASPEALIHYATLCNEKILFLIRRIEQLTIQSCRSKLLEYITSKADNSGSLKLVTSKEQWAKELGVGRASLFRELSQLQSEGLIAMSGASIAILNKPALEKQEYMGA